MTPFFACVDEMATISVSVSVSKTVPFALQLVAQLAEVLDDAVVDDRDALGRMRVGVVLGRPAVGGPAGVADAGLAARAALREPRLEVRELALGAAALELAALERRDAGGIVAAIFEPLERIDQLLRHRGASQNADDAAHAVKYPQIVESEHERATS